MKAIIPAAGFGTRFFPVSKVIPKELLPIGGRPAIQLIVEEALEAGAQEVIIVNSPNKNQLVDYFRNDPLWHSRLSGRPDACRELQHLEEISERTVFVEQTEQLGLGHAVLQAAPLLENETEPILILLGDALIAGECCASAAMAAISKQHDNASVVGLEKVPTEKISRYGIVEVESDNADNVYRVRSLVEKPDAEKAPSNLAIAGRYLLAPKIFDLLKNTAPGHGDEIQLTDAINVLAQQHPVFGYCYAGKRFDIGNPQGYLQTLQEFSSKMLKF
jgi:UTP--glucose-1-phosphate uridylyltransferase